MTEDEARTKWCPMVRLHEQPSEGKGPNMYAYNRPGVMGQMTCIASDCMAWRETQAAVPNIAAHPGVSAGQAGRFAEGYCGLAGKPE